MFRTQKRLQGLKRCEKEFFSGNSEFRDPFRKAGRIAASIATANAAKNCQFHSFSAARKYPTSSLKLLRQLQLQSMYNRRLSFQESEVTLRKIHLIYSEHPHCLWKLSLNIIESSLRSPGIQVVQHRFSAVWQKKIEVLQQP